MKRQNWEIFIQKKLSFSADSLEFKNLLNRFDSAAVQEDTLGTGVFSHVQTWQAVKRCLRKAESRKRQRGVFSGFTEKWQGIWCRTCAE